LIIKLVFQPHFAETLIIKAWKLRETKEGGIVLECLFLMEALVNLEKNKSESILAQRRELSQPYSLLKILPEFPLGE
jgi:hypothetical protein